MRILLKSSFVDRLENQVIYIAKDSPSELENSIWMC